MAIPIIFGIAAAITGVTGAVKGVKGAIDTKEASDVQERAEKILKKAQISVEEKKKLTNLAIKNLGATKLTTCAKQINNFVENFSKIKDIELEDSMSIDEHKKLSITPKSIIDMKKTVLGAICVLGDGITGVGAGVLLGWGTYGGVMALGTASTGAVIGGLSGAAATNATLAWLGGGALAAGGGGMALGTMVLGGIIAGPALLVAGGIFGEKAKEKLNNAYSNLSEAKRIVVEIETAEAEMKIIENNANQLNNLIKKLAEMLDRANFGLKQVVDSETNWNRYSKAEKNIVAAAMKIAQVVKTVINVPLLTQDGVLTMDVKKILADKNILAMAYGSDNDGDYKSLTKHDGEFNDSKSTNYDLNYNNDKELDSSKYDERGFEKNSVMHKNGTKFDDYGYSKYGYDKYGNRINIAKHNDKNINSQSTQYDSTKNERDNCSNNEEIDLSKYDERGFIKYTAMHKNGTKYDDQGFDKYGYDKDCNHISRIKHNYENNIDIGNNSYKI